MMVKTRCSEMRFEVLTAVKISIMVFWVVTPCGLAGTYHRFGGTYCPEDGCSMFVQSLIFNYKSARRHNPKDQHRQDFLKSFQSSLVKGRTQIEGV
jgi:hypothetical protein